MVRWRWERELHGNGGYTSQSRLLAGFGLLVGIGLAAQLLGSGWYMGRMLPGTTVADQNLSGLTLPQAQARLAKVASDYHLGLAIGGQQYAFTPESLGVDYDVTASVRQAYSVPRQSWWSRVQPVLGMSYHLNTSKLQAAVATVADHIGTQPVDASIVVAGGQLQTVADKDGFTVDRVSLARLIEVHIGSAVSTTLVAAPHREPAAIGVANLASAETAAQQIMAIPITLTYGTHSWTPSASAIGSWLVFARDDSGEAPHLVPQVDQTKLKAYVAGLAKQVDVAAINQLSTAKNGSVTVDRIGTNGTAINQAATVTAIAAAVAAGQPLSYTITDAPVPFKTTITNFTTLDLPSYVEINLKVQHLWVWQDGAIIYDSPITSGATGAGFPTAEGQFHIYAKETNRHLIGYQYGPRYNYDVFVKYWMPFYGGYGMHDASWRNGNFGGQDYWRGGSHGCVNLPDATAEWLYNWSVVGTPVWVHE